MHIFWLSEDREACLEVIYLRTIVINRADLLTIKCSYNHVGFKLHFRFNRSVSRTSSTSSVNSVQSQGSSGRTPATSSTTNTSTTSTAVRSKNHITPVSDLLTLSNECVLCTDCSWLGFSLSPFQPGEV